MFLKDVVAGVECVLYWCWISNLHHTQGSLLERLKIGVSGWLICLFIPALRSG